MKKIMFTLIAGAVICAAAGCGSQAQTNAPEASASSTTSSAAQTTSASEEKSDETQPSAEEDDTASGQEDAQAEGASINAGAWYAYSESYGGRYFVFYEDGTGGNFMSVDIGIGLAFEYEQDGEKTVFHMGAADDNTPATVVVNGDSIAITWEDGTQETLTYVSEAVEEFSFYTDEELSQNALEYYAAESGEDTSALEAAVGSNPDGTATIQLYSNLGDHNSTAAWYTVDRITAQGEDGNGAAVDLS